MEEEHIEPRQTQPSEAAVYRSPQHRLDIGAWDIAEIALAGHPHTFGEPAAKSCADDLFSLAVAIARSKVDQIDPSGYRVMHGGDAFVERRLTPYHTEPTAAQGQRRNRP